MIEDLTSVFLQKDDSLEKAALLLSQNTLQIVLVVDECTKLLGTVTDGDIRRALLAGHSMASPVEKFMESDPTYVHTAESRRRRLQILQDRALLHLPVIDDEGSVVGLETIQELLFRRKRNNRVLLMAGGFGKRLYPLTKDIPKPMLPVGGKPILEMILEQLAEEGFHHFVLSVHYRAQQIRDHFCNGEKWGVEIKYLEEEEPLGTGGAVGMLEIDEIDEPFIVMNGDLLTKVDFAQLVSHHTQSGSSATMCVREYEFTVPFGVVERDGWNMKKIVEKPVKQWFINAGIYVLQPELIGSFESNSALEMPDLLNKLSKEGKKVSMFPVHEHWVDIGHMEEYRQAQLDYDSA